MVYGRLVVPTPSTNVCSNIESFHPDTRPAPRFRKNRNPLLPRRATDCACALNSPAHNGLRLCAQFPGAQRAPYPDWAAYFATFTGPLPATEPLPAADFGACCRTGPAATGAAGALGPELPAPRFRASTKSWKPKTIGLAM